MVSSDLRTRAVLAPTMLLLIGVVYWLDVECLVLDKRGALSAGLLFVLGILGVLEYIAMLRKKGFAVARTLLLVAAVVLHGLAFPLGWQQLDRELYPLVAITLLLLFPLATRSLGKEAMASGLEEQGATLLGFSLISWQIYLGQGICFRHLPSLLYVVLICKGGDIGGYCFGRMFGRHKLIPHISPGKTVEGALGSLVTSIALALLLRSVLVPDLPMGVAVTLAAGILLNVTTQIGDLVESLLKRRCGAKDSSNLLPAHGGVLDLVDSLLFSFSAWFLFLVWLT
ncbi:MAG: phosphatidate cytidylyltransferase [Planctomycetota bacterium]